MASKSVSKENLVTSSIMLVNNPVSENMSSYYPETPCTSTQTSTSAPSVSNTEEYSYSYTGQPHHSTGPFSYGTYYPYTYEGKSSQSIAGTSRDCSCPSSTPKESFLHQILMGKGYRHDKLFVSTRPIVKQERDYYYYDYGCCYGYPVGYGHPTY